MERTVGHAALEFLIYFSQHLLSLLFSFSAHVMTYDLDILLLETHILAKTAERNSTGHQWNHPE